MKLIDQILEKIPTDVFTDNELSSFLNLEGNKRYGLLKRTVAKGDLIHIRRGLYALVKKYRRQEINLYGLAQNVYSPSYISLESALSFHSWIPETIKTVTSVCIKRSKEFETPLGLFVFKCLPHFNMNFVERITEGTPFLMATPLKALIDYVYVYKKDWNGIDPLIKSLRIEEEDLKNITATDLLELRESHRNMRINRFLKGLEKDLNL